MSGLPLIGLAVALVLLALLSRRLGQVTHAPPYYIGLLVSAGLLTMSAIARWGNGGREIPLEAYPVWVLIYTGLPALALTLAVAFAWRYWSWLLAERDF
jgi:hypothetical protein